MLDFIESDKLNWYRQVYPIISREGFCTTEQLVERMCALAGVYPKLLWDKKRDWDKRLTTEVSKAIYADTPFDQGFLEYYQGLTVWTRWM